MTIAEKIEIYEGRAQQEREIAARAQNAEARRAHLGLALQHEQAASREREKLASIQGLNLRTE